MVAIGLVAPLHARPIRRRRLLLLTLQRTVYKDKLLLANKVKSGRTDYGPQSQNTITIGSPVLQIRPTKS